MGAVAHAQECIDQPNGTSCTDDGEQCTDDICTAEICVHPALPVGTPCTDDGIECTQDVCGAGACQHPAEPLGTACGDPADTECDNPDKCDGLGACQDNHAPDGAPCDDLLFCTRFDACYGGLCVGHGSPCPPARVCNEDTHLCDDCVVHEDCEDLNPCTADTCQGSTCVHTPGAAGVSCGSGLNDDCTDPDTCDTFGNCQSNHAPNGASCDGGAGSCIAGMCDAPEIVAMSLPEGTFVASMATGIVPWPWDLDLDGVNDLLLIGSVQDAGGTWHAAVWEMMADGTYDLMPLDVSAMSSSANGVDCDGGSATCIVVGEMDGQPEVWIYDDIFQGGNWISEMPPLPDGATSGFVMDGEFELSGKEASVLAVGYTYDDNSNVTATVWERDVAGTWTVDLLPNPAPYGASKANVVSHSLSPNVTIIAGIGSSGKDGVDIPVMQPVVWVETSRGSRTFVDPFGLPLPAGIVAGEVRAIASSSTAGYEWDFSGYGITAAGTTVGMLWTCEAGLGNCMATVLPPLGGFANSTAGSGGAFPGALRTMHDVPMGVSFNEAPRIDGRATVWTLDFVDIANDVDAITDLNNLITPPVPGAVVFATTSERVPPGAPASHTFAACYRTDARDGRGTPSPHAAVMTVQEVQTIPAASEWGLGVLTLLMLTAGTIALRRLRPAAPVSTGTPNCPAALRFSNE